MDGSDHLMYQIIQGDACSLPLADASVDAIVCDPPYGLEFMGKEWDTFAVAPRRVAGTGGQEAPFAHHATALTPSRSREFQEWCEQWAAEALRVLKPGGHMLTFGGTRTWHRLACAIEDAGFEIRDNITWLYGSGFPKSLDVSKAIDKAAGAQREIVGVAPDRWTGRGSVLNFATDRPQSEVPIMGDPATDDARCWQGWGTALKPSYEPIIVARKPLVGTVAANVLAHGTGGINIDGCRVGAADAAWTRPASKTASFADEARPWKDRLTGDETWSGGAAGRWPTNVVLSHVPTLDERGEPDGDACADGCVPGCPVADLDRQSGTTTSRAGIPRGAAKPGDGWGMTATGAEYADSGGASRFFPTFRYQAKAPTRERIKINGVAHPTVKPLALMRWLCRLVTQPGGVILDQFAGSGTTLEAALNEGFRVIAIERDESYLPLIHARAVRTGWASPAPIV